MTQHTKVHCNKDIIYLKGIAKLRNYYPKTGVISLKSEALYISLIFNPRIKEGLKSLGLSLGQISDICTSLKDKYNM
jgi:hypothetical protein